MVKSQKIERIYNVPLRSEWSKVPKYKRAKKAVRALREFISKHMKTEINSVVIGSEANLKIWEKGIKNPPHHLKIKVVKDDVETFVELEDKFDEAYKQRVEMREEEESKLEHTLEQAKEKLPLKKSEEKTTEQSKEKEEAKETTEKKEIKETKEEKQTIEKKETKEAKETTEKKEETKTEQPKESKD